MKISLTKSNWANLILMLMLCGALTFIFYLKKEAYENEIDRRNQLAAADSLRQIDSTNYAKLAYQYFELDSISTKTILKKDEEILALTKLKAKVQIIHDTLYAEYDATDSTYLFYENNKYYLVSGRIKVIDGGLYAMVTIDSVEIPVELELAFVEMKNDMIEVRINTSNKFVVLDDVISYIKVPPIEHQVHNLGVFGGLGFGPSYGIFGGLRYKKFYLVGSMQNNGYFIGGAYEYWIK